MAKIGQTDGSRLLGVAQGHTARRSRFRSLLFGAALAVFLAGALFSARRLQLSFEDIDWRWVALVAGAGGPATLLLNAGEFRLLARMTGVGLTFRHALHVTAVAAGLNWLPVPAAAATRVAALGYAGVGLPRATAFVLNLFVVWAGLATAAVGVALTASAPTAGALVTVGGITVGAGGCWFFLHMNAPRSLVAGVLAFRTLLLVVDAVRLWACLLAIGVPTPLWRSAAIAASSVVGSAASVIPAGLGVHEIAAAFLAPIAGIPGTGGFLAAGVNRIAGLLAVPILVLLSARKGGAREGRLGEAKRATDRSRGAPP